MEFQALLRFPGPERRMPPDPDDPGLTFDARQRVHPGCRTRYLSENISQTRDEAHVAGRVAAVHYLRLPPLRQHPSACLPYRRRRGRRRLRPTPGGPATTPKHPPVHTHAHRWPGRKPHRVNPFVVHHAGPSGNPGPAAPPRP